MQRFIRSILTFFRNHSESEIKVQNYIRKLLKTCPETEHKICWEELRGFLRLFRKFSKNIPSINHWSKILPLSENNLKNLDYFPLPNQEEIKNILNKLVLIKLNGGLGTSMQCSGPKSLLFLKDCSTFLDLTIEQIENINKEYDVDVPLVLMNSFNTDDETKNALHKYGEKRVRIVTFLQNRYPRFNSDTFDVLPKTYVDENKFAWYPPGHGNFYEAFYKSGILEKFIENGKECCFVSNIDNLGATVNFGILFKMLNKNRFHKTDFLIEVTRKTPSDVKGGTLVHYHNKLKLLEIAAMPDKHIQDFDHSSKFRFFNTNNVWIKLTSILQFVNQGKHLDLDVIVNRKTIAQNGENIKIIQLETALGSAVQSFEYALGIVVPRSRFLPVKTSSDLFLMRSNVYMVDNGIFTINPSRKLPYPPHIKLEGEYFQSYWDIDYRFKEMPDCLELNKLNISGNVVFGKNIMLKGDVVIRVNPGYVFNVPDGSVLENYKYTD